MRTTLILFLLYSHFAAGWGRIGHEATAIIAFGALTPSVKTKVLNILGTEDLRQASLWPDVIRNQRIWNHTKNYHFTQVPDNLSYYESLRNASAEEKAKGDAVRAMVKVEDILRNPRSTDIQKNYALQFLVHFIGDIHQPLHTGRPEDMGGNLILINWFGLKSNLHSIWDTGIITASMEFSGVYRPGMEEDAEFYVSLLSPPTRSQVMEWQKASFMEWHNESSQLRSQSYLSATMTNQEVVKSYRKAVDLRIQQAGFRLAYIINTVFEGRSLTAEGIQLRKNLSAILGPNHDQVIKIEPQNNKDDGTELNSTAHGHECYH